MARNYLATQDFVVLPFVFGAHSFGDNLLTCVANYILATSMKQISDKVMSSFGYNKGDIITLYRLLFLGDTIFLCLFSVVDPQFGVVIISLTNIRINF